jgi:excisionase family DNA binding protein
MTKANSRSAEPATYRVPEAARVAGVGNAAIRKGVHNGTVPHIRFGRNILIPRAAFHRWLDSCGRIGGAAT